MTLIVGLRDAEGRVWMGADAGSWDDAGFEWTDGEPKIIRRGPLLMGFCGDTRFYQLVAYGLKPPPVKGEEPVPYLVTKIVPKIRKLLRDGGALSVVNEKETGGGAILFALAGRMFYMSEEFDVSEPRRDYLACGATVNVACGYGSLATSSPDLPPEARLRYALAAAEDHSPMVRGPFQIEAA